VSQDDDEFNSFDDEETDKTTASTKLRALSSSLSSSSSPSTSSSIAVTRDDELDPDDVERIEQSARRYKSMMALTKNSGSKSALANRVIRGISRSADSTPKARLVIDTSRLQQEFKKLAEQREQLVIDDRVVATARAPLAQNSYSPHTSRKKRNTLSSSSSRIVDRPSALMSLSSALGDDSSTTMKDAKDARSRSSTTDGGAALLDGRATSLLSPSASSSALSSRSSTMPEPRRMSSQQRAAVANAQIFATATATTTAATVGAVPSSPKASSPLVAANSLLRLANGRERSTTPRSAAAELLRSPSVKLFFPAIVDARTVLFISKRFHRRCRRNRDRSF
jgi:hypothetical protein